MDEPIAKLRVSGVDNACHLSSSTNWMASSYGVDTAQNSSGHTDKACPLIHRCSLISRIACCATTQSFAIGSEEKFLEKISHLAEMLKSPKSKLRHPEAVQRSIGHLQQKYSRVAKLYTVSYESGKLEWLRSESYNSDISLHGDAIFYARA